MTSRRLLLVGIAAVLSTSCAPHEEGESTKPGTPEVEPKDPTRAEPEPEPEPSKQLAAVTIASVQMVQDCPEQDATPSAAPAPAPGAAAAPMPPAAEAVQDESRMARGRRKPGRAPIRQPCTQSTMQLSFTGQGPTSAKVKIEAVRVLAATGEKVGTVNARLPTAWKDGTYQTWDETLGPQTDVKASYKLSVPNWNDVEAKLGDRNPYETMFVLEVDVEVGGELQTVRSQQFVRERPHVIVT